MEILFWGSRGSLPYGMTSAMIRQKVRSALAIARENNFGPSSDLDHFIDHHLPFHTAGGYGCNTSCVQVVGGDEYVICDAGTGLRDMGNSIMKTLPANHSGQVFNIFLSHLHWDHIQGFPFFVPAFIPGNTVNIYGYHDGLEDAFTRQQAPPFFPVPLTSLGATVNFIRLDIETQYRIAGFTISGIEQHHPGDSYGYSFERQGRKVVYCSDSEHKTDPQETQAFIRFCKNADVLIMDAQYPLFDSLNSKKDWGHSSNIMATELAVMADVKRLCLFHHEHAWNDEALDQFLADTRQYLALYDRSSLLILEMAYDGLHIVLENMCAPADSSTRNETQKAFIEEKDGLVIFNLTGRMDSLTCADLEPVFLEHLQTAPSGVILNMENLEYISSAGLRTVLTCKKQARNVSKQMMLCGLTGSVKNVFKIAGFSSFIDLDLSLSESMRISGS